MLSPNWLPVVILSLAGCAQSATVMPYGSDVLPLDANGLPPHYSLCARNRAVGSVSIAEVYYGCYHELTGYAASLSGVPQEQKAALVDGMENKALDYAHEQVVARHGAEAVRAALMGLPPLPKAANRPAQP